MRQVIVLRIIFGFYSRNIQDSYSFVFLAFLALYANERKYVIRVVGGCKIFACFRRVHTVAGGFVDAPRRKTPFARGDF